MTAFDPASVAALLAQLTARAIVLELTVEDTGIRYIPSRAVGADQAIPSGPPPYKLLTVTAVYRSPDRPRSIYPDFSDRPALLALVPPNAQPDVAGGVQRSFGPKGFQLVVDACCLDMGKAILLQFLSDNFDLHDLRMQGGRSPQLVP